MAQVLTVPAPRERPGAGGPRPRIGSAWAPTLAAPNPTGSQLAVHTGKLHALAPSPRFHGCGSASSNRSPQPNGEHQSNHRPAPLIALFQTRTQDTRPQAPSKDPHRPTEPRSTRLARPMTTYERTRAGSSSLMMTTWCGWCSRDSGGRWAHRLRAPVRDWRNTLILQNAIDTVVIDVMLPDIDGDRLARLLRNTARSSDATIVLVSGRSTDELQALALTAGADAVLTKADIRSKLVTTVESARRRRASGRVRPARAGRHSRLHCHGFEMKHKIANPSTPNCSASCLGYSPWSPSQRSARLLRSTRQPSACASSHRRASQEEHREQSADDGRHHALALRGLVAENAFTDVQQLVDRAVRADEDVIYGVFVSSEDTPLAYSSPSTQSMKEGDLQSSLKRWTEIALPIGSGKSKQGSEREAFLFRQAVLEVVAPGH